ncbi:uncharacterized protein MONBRDRAFT_33137 [Monosiga brevicollis MX1]|uniref:Cyclin-like domain-containing protein n=1 Tax=Monosiga brevicollis TaxID=81824 RepID=A9V3X2_MONBE|nr:uncharacterized protein MONBRDRAFT_33137 [Monosiga brevicollis MX1]EDQ87879.1 predicted protein [Monosiga brevicollis MX1]|eukprot:XP_001747412.1 hypothetical protein [Monosiga brevicollis MX1]
MAQAEQQNVRIEKHVFPCLDSDLPRFDLANTPSRRRGIPAELELRLRIAGCELIQKTGMLLGCKQVVMACAQMLLQRAYCRLDISRHSLQWVGLACLFLAAKTEEDHQRLRSILLVGRQVAHRMTREYAEKQTELAPMIVGDDDYHELKNNVIKSERRVLKELGFCVHLKHPHKDVAQLAWNYMNDALRSDVFLRFEVAVIACACIDLATRKLDIPMPDLWFQSFGVHPDDFEQTCATILQLYRQSPVYLDDLARELELALQGEDLTDPRLAAPKKHRGRSPQREGSPARVMHMADQRHDRTVIVTSVTKIAAVMSAHMGVEAVGVDSRFG